MSYFTWCLVNRLNHYATAEKQRSNLKVFYHTLELGVKFGMASLLARKANKRVLNLGFIFNGGIGDQVIGAQWVRAFLSRLASENCDFFSLFFVPKTKSAELFIAGMPGKFKLLNHRYIKKYKYDLLLEVDQFIKVFSINKAAIQRFAPFLAAEIPQAQKLTRELWPLMDANHHFQLMNYSLRKGWNRYDLIGACGLCKYDRHSPGYFAVDPEAVQATLDKFKLPKIFVTMHTGVGGIPEKAKSPEELLKMRANATRSIPKSLGDAFVKELKSIRPDLMLIQIGDNSSQIFAGVDLNLRGKTTFQESLHLLYAAAAHIDNDAGLVHIRHAMGKRSVVLYGPTDGRFVGYDSDLNLQGNCRPCMWLSADWNTRCPAGYKCAECMQSIDPRLVADAAVRLVESI